MKFQEIKDFAEVACDQEMYRHFRAMQMYLTGNYDPSKSMQNQAYPCSTVGTSPFPLQEYEARPYGSGMRRAVVNHAFINARILQESIVFNQPEFTFPDITHPMVKAFNNGWLQSRWAAGGWASHFLEAAMTGYEPCGISFIQVGIVPWGEFRMTSLRSVDPLDMIWDPVHTNPEEWDRYLLRNRVNYDDWMRRYSLPLGEDRAKKLFERSARTMKPRTGSAKKKAYAAYEWEYWSENYHAIILPSDGKLGAVMLAWDGEQYVESEVCGENPFGIIPIVPWWDMMAPGTAVPVGKAEYSYAVVSQINLFDQRERDLIDNVPPTTAISTTGLQDEDLINHLKDGKTLGEWGKPILTKLKEPGEIVHRIDGATIPPQWQMMKESLRRDLNAVTGVSDASRGQAVDASDRVSATEIRHIQSQQNIQASHARRQYANALSSVATVARVIGAQYDNTPLIINAGGVEFEPTISDFSVMLEAPSRIVVQEDSILGLDSVGRRQAAIADFTAIYIPAIQAGVINPAEAFKRLFAKVGEPGFDEMTAQAQPQMPGAPGAAPGGEELPPEAMAMMNEMVGTAEGQQTMA